MHSFTIKDLENLSGIKAHTIRIWEQRYQFLKPSRTDTNIRFYSCDELKKLLNIALLNKHGYKISQIDKMCEQELAGKIMLLSATGALQERVVNDLIQAMVDMDMKNFEETLQLYISNRGTQRAITQVVFPFLEKIGVLWLTNHINPAQEHLVSNIIRQKLMVGIEAARPSLKTDKTIVLFLPEGEHHEIGLLFVHYLLKCRGINVIYLGANIPISDVEYVVKMKAPDYLFSHLTSVAHKFNFETFIAAITRKFVGIPVVITGKLTQTYKKKLPATIRFKRSFNELMLFISQL